MSLAFQTFGNGHPIVLLHGLFGSGDNLRILARNLEERYRVFLPDLPNHGASPHLSSATHGAMVDALEQFVLENSLEQPILAGHSLGGKLAMLMALRQPDRYPAVVSIDMAPRRYEASHLEIMAGMRDMPLETIESRRDADLFLSQAVPVAAVRGFLLKNLVREETGYRWRLNLAAIASDYDALLGWEPPDAIYSGPAIFVGGEHSTYLQAERDAEAIGQWFPEAGITMITDAGHWLHADKPDQLLEIMNRFLSGLHLA